MAWLCREGEVLATVEVASSLGQRVRGLLGRDGVEGAVLLSPARSVHTVGMRFPIDVAFCDRDMVVLCTVTMGRHRVARPRWRARSVLEAEAGAFERWCLRVG
ncbi:MAG: DUF192 domain-containing protein, partial [Actinobacteria bacterium]|nr:DUF192 domain-containing protein [Actinomycetota bacterium]